MSLMRGAINDPQNKSLRRGMLSFGLDSACKDLMGRTTSLREGSDTQGAATNPTNGRFFPKTCTQSTAANGDLIMAFTGQGYTWATGVQKATFDASATVQFDQDFLMAGDDLYAYFRVREVTKPTVAIRLVEAPLAALANRLTGLGEQYARSLFDERLREGFTLRRRADSETDFRAGIVELGTWPKLDFSVRGGATLANDRTEVHERQRDFVGPFVLDDNDDELQVAGRIDGAPTLNVLAMADEPARRWIDQYLTQPVAGPPPAAPAQLTVARQGQEFRLNVGQKGTWWIVFDNTATIAGGARPPGNLLDDRAAVVSYAIVRSAKR